MDRLTRILLRLLGWRPSLGVDASGSHYESWYKLGTPKPAYFFVYHERLANGDIVRPIFSGRRRK